MLKLAEVFESIQGEGAWAGTPMLFIRTAGCNVGRPLPSKQFQKVEPPTNLVVIDANDKALLVRGVHTICTSALGQQFICDTDYDLKLSRTPQEVVEMLQTLPFVHICLTGGEPLLQQKELLNMMVLAAATGQWRQFHIETSGTVSWWDADAIHAYHALARAGRIWVTCSPKKGFLPEFTQYVDEWKFVYHSEEDCSKFIASVDSIVNSIDRPTQVYIQPINAIHSSANLDAAEVGRWMEILRMRPQWRLGVQLHKYLGMR